MTLDLVSATDMFISLAPCSGPAVTLDLGNAADMFNLDPHGGPRWRATGTDTTDTTAVPRRQPVAGVDVPR